MIASTQITNTEIFTFIAILVFKLAIPVLSGALNSRFIHIKQHDIFKNAFSQNKVKPGLFLTTSCVRYMHVVPFMRNEMPYSLVETPP